MSVAPTSNIQQPLYGHYYYIEIFKIRKSWSGDWTIFAKAYKAIVMSDHILGLLNRGV